VHRLQGRDRRRSDRGAAHQISVTTGVSNILSWGALCAGGSVWRMGSHVRANAQLIDAATDAHLWAERFDGDAADLFALVSNRDWCSRSPGRCPRRAG
jgi:hypothetical protein